MSSRLVVYLVEGVIALSIIWLLFKLVYFRVFPRGVVNAVKLRKAGEKYERDLRKR